MNEKFLGYTVDKHKVLRNAPCGCPQCRDEGRQPGHPYCNDVPAELLAAEEAGEIVANLDNAGWYWTTTK